MKNEKILELALPKGRMQQKIFELFAEACIPISLNGRDLRPEISLKQCEAKLLKPQNVVSMLNEGSRDIGFAGADWVKEMGADLIELLDTKFDPVRLVIAAPIGVSREQLFGSQPLKIASEYQELTRLWASKRGVNAHFIASSGATEVYPPEDADCILDNCASGATLRTNRLEIVDEFMRSSTRLYANPKSLADPVKAKRINNLVELLGSVLEARKRVMLEMNISKEKLESIFEVLPSMRAPTISKLYLEAGYAVKAAVAKAALPELLGELKARGATDIIVSSVAQLLP